MPEKAQTQVIDWAGIRAAAVTIGIRAAARQAAHALPPIEQQRFVKRVLKRAEREGWMKAKQAAMSLVPVSPSGPSLPLSSHVVTGSDLMAKQLADDSTATRVGFSKAARKVAQHASTLEPADLMDKDTSQAAKHWHGVAAGVHGWEQKQDQTAVMVNVALLMG